VHELIEEGNPRVNSINLTIAITGASGAVDPGILPLQSAIPDTRAGGATASNPAFQLTTPRVDQRPAPEAQRLLTPHFS